MSTLYELTQSAIEELKEWANDNFDDGYMPEPHDTILEIADSHVPVYTSDLMELAAQNINLATDEPELGPAFDGSPTPVNIIAANVLEYLEDKLWGAWADIQTGIEEEWEKEQELLEDKEE